MQICTVTKDKAAKLLNVSPRLVAAVKLERKPACRDCGEVGEYAAWR
jgi:hypothetical protein